jgi:hypothetical protein
MSAWLSRLQKLDLEKHAGAEISEISEMPSGGPERAGFGDNGDFGTAVFPETEGSEPIAWHKREDVRLVVEDLFRERWHPRRIGRHLGLTHLEVQMILRSTGP